MPLISVTFDTYHCPIGPRGPLEQSPLGASLRHALTALLSSALDRGKYAGACVCVCVCADGTVCVGGDGVVGLSSKQVERICHSAKSRRDRFRVSDGQGEIGMYMHLLTHHRYNNVATC